jgi:anaerobic ribonucleoside-triphosphate reductase
MQAPFLTIFMYLNEAKSEQEKEDLAMLIEETLKQRYIGVKNDKGVWVSPSFPKLIYVLEEDNIKEDGKYYYLTKLAVKCSAKRLVPDYISEKIMMELKEGNCYPVMGCVDKDEMVTYKYKDILYVESISNMWDRLRKAFHSQSQARFDPNLYMDIADAQIYDSEHGFVNVRRMVRNVSNNWMKITFSNGRILDCTSDHPLPVIGKGRTFVKDIKVGDKVPIITTQYSENTDTTFNEELAYAYAAYIFGNWTDYQETSKNPYQSKDIEDLMEKIHTKEKYHVPVELFRSPESVRLSFLAGMHDAIGNTKVENTDFPVMQYILVDNEKEFALGIMLLLQSLNIYATIHHEVKLDILSYLDMNPDYYVEAQFDARFLDYLRTDEHTYGIIKEMLKNIPKVEAPEYLEVTSIEPRACNNKLSYDVTTETDYFDVSGIYSHNCRSALAPWKDENGNYKFYGRFNQGVVTVSLPYIALESGKDMNKFWEIFEERTELCHRALMCRHKRLRGTSVEVAPILWKYGALARLGDGETIDPLLYNGYSSISLGYAGLYECTKYMTGCSHSDGGVGEKFALEVMQKLNDKCNQWKEEDHIGYSLYGTPIESTTYKFAKAMQRDFGIIKGITDRDYVTNSYHIPVFEDIDAFEKLRIEAKFQKLSPGGAISYIETPDMQNNTEALMEVVKFIYDNIMYAELNTKSDYCKVCGYDKEISLIKDESDKYIWECPNCGNRDPHLMNVARRTCGYIGTASNGWNQGRLGDIHDRVLHIKDTEFQYEDNK